MNHLKWGLYRCLYSPLDGLDVSHVGIVFKRGERGVVSNALLLIVQTEVGWTHRLWNTCIQTGHRCAAG